MAAATMMAVQRKRWIDQDGNDMGGLSGRVHPAGWAMKTRIQKGQPGLWVMAGGADCPPASHRRDR